VIERFRKMAQSMEAEFVERFRQMCWVDNVADRFAIDLAQANGVMFTTLGMSLVTITTNRLSDRPA
jgi:hypothetical protein